MEYNTKRENLVIPEYGRHIQKMVDHCLTIEDEKDRNQFAEVIIDVMGELNPHLRDIPDFQHKLWDQMYIMSDFKLKVDSPYQLLNAEEVQRKPNRVPYPQDDYKYRYYGKNILRMIDVATTWEDGDKKDALIVVIANHMKKCYLMWNKDTVDDRVIFTHLNELSDGKINIIESDETLSSFNNIQNNNKSSNTRRKKNNRRKR